MIQRNLCTKFRFQNNFLIIRIRQSGHQKQISVFRIELIYFRRNNRFSSLGSYFPFFIIKGNTCLIRICRPPCSTPKAKRINILLFQQGSSICKIFQNLLKHDILRFAYKFRGFRLRFNRF